MPTPFSPIPSPVPLRILRSSIEEQIAAIPPDRDFAWFSGNLKTRFSRRCRDHGVNHIWMLATFTYSRFSAMKDTGKKTASFAEGVLALTGLHFESFASLTAALELVEESLGKRWSDTGFSEILTVLAGIGDWAKAPEIVAALAVHGLRPGMPLEELFVYDPSLAAPVEPKRPTPAEELLAFGALLISEVFPKRTTIDFTPGLRVIEFMALLACDSGRNRVTAQERAMLVAAARRHLSSEAQKRIGVWTEHQEGLF